MSIYRNILTAATLLLALSAVAQVESAGAVRRRNPGDKKQQNNSSQVTERMQKFYEHKEPGDADLVWTRDIYRQINLKRMPTPLSISPKMS